MKRFKKIYGALLVVGGAVLILTAGISPCCLAAVTEEELKNWPEQSYQGEELKKVREWEKTWAGKKINKDNIDQLKDFMSDQFYQVFKNPKDWGADELFFTIVPYQRVMPTPGQIAATRKNALNSKLDPNPRKAFWKEEIGPNEFLVGWDKGETAGYPFPYPKTGLEMAWNIESNTRGDTKEHYRDGAVVNPRTKAERKSRQPWMFDYFTGRVDAPPVPKKPKNPKNIRRAFYAFIELPLDVQGTRYMELRYLDVKKADDVWVWFPLFRRIRRMGFSYKQDTIDGTDLGPDDEAGWNGHTNLKTWNLVGRKDMLFVRHQDLDKLERVKGQSVWNGYMMERVNAYVLETKWKDPNAPYSKEILYMEPETYRTMQKVTWDRQGREWRQFFYSAMQVKSLQGIDQMHCFELYSSDLQRKHGCPTLDPIKTIGRKIPNRFWSIQNLQKMGY